MPKTCVKPFWEEKYVIHIKALKQALDHGVMYIG